VRRDRVTTTVRMGLRVGVIAAAATTGALAAFGTRQGAPLRAFAELVSTRPEMAGPRLALLGLAAQALAAIALGIAFALVAARLRGVRLLAGAAVFACLAFVLNDAILPSPHVSAGVQVLDSAHLAALHLLLAVALAVGMRLALIGSDLG
jgi:hypothetical protein